MNMIKPSDLPAPDTVIDYGNGSFGPVMFHYLHEDVSWVTVAREEGFECRVLTLDEDYAKQPDHPILQAYEEGEDVLAQWDPSDQGDGWKLVLKADTEDGPLAIFVRPLEEAPATEAQSSHPDTK